MSGFVKASSRAGTPIHVALLLTLVFALFDATPAVGGSVQIIANSSIQADSITAREIKSVFLEERNSLRDGTRVEPVLARNGPVHAEFLGTYLGFSESDLQNHYRVLVFTGRGSMPKAFGSDAEIVAYVSRTRGAIGYISAEAKPDGVKTLAVEDSAGSHERKLVTRVEPEYPETLKQLKIGGIVRLRIAIAAHGNVETADLIGGNPILGEAAEAAVRKWMYAPGKSRTIVEVELRFDEP